MEFLLLYLYNTDELPQGPSALAWIKSIVQFVVYSLNYYYLFV